MKALGADIIIDTSNTPDWEKEVLGLTRGRGVDLVVENGGAGTLSRSLKAVWVGGTVTMTGVLSGFEGTLNTALILPKALTVQGLFVGNRQQFLEMNEGLRANGIHPVVDHIYAFPETSLAYRDLEAARHVGKPVIRILRKLQSGLVDVAILHE